MKSIDLHTPPFVLLDDSRHPHKAAPSLLFHSPEYIIKADNFDELESVFAEIDAAVGQGFHVAGWIAYECARYFEPKLETFITKKAKEPLVWMLVTRHRLSLSSKELETLFHTADRGNIRQADLLKGEPAQTEDQYIAALKTVNDFINAGDVYQINHTLPIPVELHGSALTLYRKLRQRQPVAYGAYIDTGAEKILSLSPELFLKKKGDTLTARPMKGTAPRGMTQTEDHAIQQTLKEDPKSQAENLMIVDLIRNDLSRVSSAGSVKVPQLFDVEQYPTLHQMTSTVTATARQHLKPSTLLAGMFPCGSVTGAPKHRAIEIISSLEPAPRGVYCGTIGYFSPRTETSEGTKVSDENWCLNVPIRTLVLEQCKQGNKATGRMSIGSGVVADSNPVGEYQECLLKAAFTDGAPVNFSLIETMKYKDGSITNISEHLGRLESSARYFDFKYEQDAVEAAISGHIKSLAQSNATQGIRLLLDKYGATSVTSFELKTDTQQLNTVCLSASHTISHDPFLYHKTTNRDLYSRATAAARHTGHADILFFNEKGALTEGAISNIFLEKDGILYTPPVSAGLLSGTFRSHLLATRDNIQEKTLYRDDLLNADKIFIGNALRGLRRVILSEDIWLSEDTWSPEPECTH